MLTGSEYVSKMSPKLYIKPYTTAFTKPTGLTKALAAAAALTAFEGTKATSTFLFKAAQALADGDFIVVSSPYNAYAVYADDDGAHAAHATVVTNASAAGCTALLPVTIATADLTDMAVCVPAIVAALNTTDDLTASFTVATDYTMVVVAVKGGVRKVASAVSGITTLTSGTIVTDALEVGDWTEIGSCADDYAVGVEANEVEGMEGESLRINDKITAEFRFLNLTERNIDILKTFDGTKVSFALVDATDRDLPEIYCVNDILFNAGIAPAGDMKNAPLKLSKRVKKSLTATYFWSFDNELL